MNVLHLTHKPIYPILDGGQLAMQRMLMNILHMGFNVKSLSIETHKHPFDINAIPPNLIPIINPEAIYVNTKITPINVLKSLFTSESYNVKRFHCKKFEDKLIELLKLNHYDIIIMESIFLLPYIDLLRKLSRAKIIVRTHNVEYKIWKQNADKQKNFLKKIYFKKLSRNLKKFELNFLNQVDGIFCISEKDKDFFRKRSIHVQMIEIPVYMEKTDDKKVDYKNQDFFFIGSMSWKPNSDAVKWIVKYIAPSFEKINPQIKIHIAGSSMPKSMKEMKLNNVVFHGKVPSIVDFMTNHGTLIVPIKSGSGVRIKILEALSIGVPIISTDKGKEGIQILPKSHYLSANSTEEFILQMKEISSNHLEKERLGNAAIQFIEQEYSIEIISKKIRDFISKL